MRNKILIIIFLFNKVVTIKNEIIQNNKQKDENNTNLLVKGFNLSSVSSM
jgi:hypothetical protein